MVSFGQCGEITVDRTIFIAVGRLEGGTYRVGTGLPETALAQLQPATEYIDIVLVRVLDVIGKTLDAFEQCGLMHCAAGGLTVNPRDLAFPEWCADVARLRQLSRDRLQRRAALKHDVTRAATALA